MDIVCSSWQNRTSILFFGSDNFSVGQRGREIVKVYPPEALEIMTSEATKVAEVVDELKTVCEALRTRSLFSTEKCVWYKDVYYLNDSVILKSDSVVVWLETLQQILQELPDDVGFLLTAGNCDKRQKWVKWLTEHLQTTSYEIPKVKDCERYVLEKVKHAGCQITSEALGMLLQRTGNELAFIDRELEKVLLYVMGKGENPTHLKNSATIESADVDAVVMDIHSSDFFETVDLFFQRNFAIFLKGIQRYFLYQEEGRPLLAALQNRVRLLAQLAYLHEHNHVSQINKLTLERLAQQYPEAGAESIFTQNPWYLNKLFPIAQQRTSEIWFQFQSKLLTAIVELVRYQHCQQFVFESLYFHLNATYA